MLSTDLKAEIELVLSFFKDLSRRGLISLRISNLPLSSELGLLPFKTHSARSRKST